MKWLSIIALGLSLAGCGYRPADVADPSDITLRAAVLDVADTLAEAKARTIRRGSSVGLYVDEATVEFNISAKANETNTLNVKSSVPAALIGVPFSIDATNALVNEGNRGNKITLKFKNLITTKLPPDRVRECIVNPAAPGCVGILSRQPQRPAQ